MEVGELVLLEVPSCVDRPDGLCTGKVEARLANGDTDSLGRDPVCAGGFGGVTAGTRHGPATAVNWLEGDAVKYRGEP